MALCGSRPTQIIRVRRDPQEWPTCAAHGRITFMALMNLFPGQGIYTKKVNDGRRDTQGTV